MPERTRDHSVYQIAVQKARNNLHQAVQELRDTEQRVQEAGFILDALLEAGEPD